MSRNTSPVGQVANSSAPSIVRTRWRWIAAIAVLVVAGTAVAMKVEAKSYTSTASVVLGPEIFANSAEPLAPDIGTAKSVATSTAVLGRVAGPLGLSTTALQKGLSVTNPANTNILVFADTSSSPRVAQQRAQAVASAFCAYQNAELPAVAKEQQGGSQAQTSTLSVEPATLVSSANLPTKPAGHSLVLDLIVALVAGLGLGFGAVLLMDRFGDRVQGPADVETKTGRPVLAEIPESARLLGKEDPIGSLRSDSAVSAAYRSLRVRLQELAPYPVSEELHVADPNGSIPSLRHESRAARRVILVTSPLKRPASTPPVALGLAISIASSGRRVALVGADLQSRPIRRLFGAERSPGLAELLRDEVDAGAALLETPLPNLHVVAEGADTLSAEDLFDHTRLAHVFSRLHRAGCEVVVVDGLSLLDAPESLALVSSADQLVVAVDPRAVGRGQLQQVAGALAVHDDAFSGVVIVSNPRRRHVAEDRAPKNIEKSQNRTPLRPGGSAKKQRDDQKSEGANATTDSADHNSGRLHPHRPRVPTAAAIRKATNPTRNEPLPAEGL